MPPLVHEPRIGHRGGRGRGGRDSAAAAYTIRASRGHGAGRRIVSQARSLFPEPGGCQKSSPTLLRMADLLVPRLSRVI